MAGGGCFDQSAIEYRVKGQTEAQMVAAQEDFFTDDGVKNNQYLAKLQELQADTDYEYRVVTEAAASDWHTLHTSGQRDFECLIFPDSQSSDYSDWKAVAQNAAERNPQAAFFINMGDIVDNGEDHTQWQAWFHGVNGIIDRIPFVPMMGNHETYDQKWKVRLPEAYLHYFVVPENNSRDFSRYYYSFDYGEVHFMVLNSQWDETEDFKPGLMAEQLNWLRKMPVEAAKSGKSCWCIRMSCNTVSTNARNGRKEFLRSVRNLCPCLMNWALILSFLHICIHIATGDTLKTLSGTVRGLSIS